MSEAGHDQLVAITGMLFDEPALGRLGLATFGSCTLKSIGRITSDPFARNSCWSLIVHRRPAVELLKAAMPGDVLEVLGVVRGAVIIVPRTEGRLDVLLAR